MSLGLGWVVLIALIMIGVGGVGLARFGRRAVRRELLVMRRDLRGLAGHDDLVPITLLYNDVDWLIGLCLAALRGDRPWREAVALAWGLTWPDRDELSAHRSRSYLHDVGKLIRLRGSRAGVEILDRMTAAAWRAHILLAMGLASAHPVALFALPFIGCVYWASGRMPGPWNGLASLETLADQLGAATDWSMSHPDTVAPLLFEHIEHADLNRLEAVG